MNIQERLKIKGELFCKISAILFRHDPMGINLAENIDEYDPEAKAIIPQLSTANSAKDVEKIVIEEFIKYFNLDKSNLKNEEIYRKIAEEIWELYLKSKKVPLYVLEDEFHSEWIGEFSSRDEAIEELKKLSKIPWNEGRNRAPCMSWRKCGRSYVLIDYERSFDKWHEIKRVYMAEVNRTGFKWMNDSK